MAVFSGCLLIAALLLVKPSWSAPAKACDKGGYECEREASSDAVVCVSQCESTDLDCGNNYDMICGYCDENAYGKFDFNDQITSIESLDCANQEIESLSLDKDTYLSAYRSNGKLRTSGVDLSCYKTWEQSKEKNWESCKNIGSNSCYKYWYNNCDDYNNYNEYYTENCDLFAYDMDTDLSDYDATTYENKNIKGDVVYSKSSGDSYINDDSYTKFNQCKDNSVVIELCSEESESIEADEGCCTACDCC